MAPWLFLFLGGGLGALSRHSVGALMLHLTGWQGHWSTMTVNVTGCFLMGFLATMVGLKFSLGMAGRYFFFTGFLGAYTTFSTYMLENFLLFEEGRWVLAFTNMFGSVALGIVAMFSGVALARAL